MKRVGGVREAVVFLGGGMLSTTVRQRVVQCE